MSSSHLCNWGNLAEVIGSCQSPNPTSKDCNCSHELFIEEEKNGQQAYFFYFAQNKFQINQKVREILLTYSTVTLFSNKADIQITRRQYLWMSADMFGNEDVKIDCALTIVPSAWLCLAVFLALRAKDRKCKVQSSFKYSLVYIAELSAKNTHMTWFQQRNTERFLQKQFCHAEVSYVGIITG